MSRPRGAPAACLALLVAAMSVAASDEAADLYVRAGERLAAGDAAGALELLDRAVELAPDRPGGWDLRGWALLRLGRPRDAEASFRAALERDPSGPGSITGLGYALLHRGRATLALAQFDAALALDPVNGDAARGRVRAWMRLSRWDEAEQAVRALQASGANDPELAALAASIAVAVPAREGRPFPPLDPSAPLQVPARAGTRYLETAGPEGFRPLFVKGVNLGVALPGRFPTEFPLDRATYHGWLDDIAAMNANAVRLYTLLPPAFYAALREHNHDHPGRTLWLIQGAWVELPPTGDFEDEQFKASFQREIERVIDALHGNLDLPEQPGHASGRYRADVSDHTLALVLGREWEPFSVVDHDALHPGERRYEGRYARLAAGTAMEAWLAWVVDLAVAYETDRYRAQRPVAFSNWPTLDPLAHAMESSRAEENAVLRALGEDVQEDHVPHYNDDQVSVDAERIVPTDANQAGLFASYHVYPYHPDFMNLDPALQEARDARGISPYFGYLRALKAHHRRQPLLVTEVGVPTSRGIAHVNPQGWNHGGQSEREQGERYGRMMDGVLESGSAGGVLFAWLDEWFKRTWITGPFEIPPERDPLWHNLMDPEESFGILAARAGPRSGGHVLDGDAAEWDGLSGALRDRWPATAGDDAARIHGAGVSADAAWLHLLVESGGLSCAGSEREPGWEGAALLIGIDTHGDEAGDHRLAPGDAPLPTGVEFRVRLSGPGDSALEVDPPYDIGSHEPDGPFASRPNDDGIYSAMARETNRRRIGRDGTVYPSVVVDASPLRFLRTPADAPEQADVAARCRDGIAVVEIRLPWALLNVTDPSSHQVLDQPTRHPPPFEASTTDGLRLYLSLRARGGAAVDARVLGPYLWEGWDAPEAHLELKASYAIVQRKFAEQPDQPAEDRP